MSPQSMISCTSHLQDSIIHILLFLASPISENTLFGEIDGCEGFGEVDPIIRVSHVTKGGGGASMKGKQMRR